MLDYYPELKYLIFPSKEKKIEIPFYLLAKFYLHMYTYESDFFKFMNKDLTNSKFDLYRVYIFLQYIALNQKSLKPYYEKSVYRGACLSKQELEKIYSIINKTKNGKNSKINEGLYFSKTFLSFSKSCETAKGFIKKGIENSIPVLFEVEGLSEKKIKENNDFFFSNVDLENISEFNEGEVLFLPFSCFRIISVKDEKYKLFGDKINVKKITLKYLYKYIEKINQKELFEQFLNEVINSEYSKEISGLINFDIGNEFKSFIQQKFHLQDKICNFNLIQSIKNTSQDFLQTKFNNLFPEEATHIQKVLIGKTEGILVGAKDGSNILLRQENNKIIWERVPDIKQYQPPMKLSEPSLQIKKVDGGTVAHKMEKSNNEFIEGKNKNACDECVNKIKKKEEKLEIQQSNYFELYSMGLLIGDFIANYGEIKDEPLIVKIKSFGTLGVSCLIPFLPKILSTLLPQAVTMFPIAIASISACQLIISMKNVITDKSLTKSETAKTIFKQIAFTLFHIGASYVIGQIGFKILVAMSVGPGIIVSIVAIGLGIGVGYAISKIKKYYDEKDKSENLALFSESTYSEYIPTKFREYCIPTLCWKGVSKKAKSFALELIEDGYRKWLVINIKHWIRKLDNENYLDVGEHIVEYKGISKHASKVTFILYELKKEICTPEEWGVGEKISDNYSEELSKNYIQVAVLDVF